jgi:protein O-GlcNAc transferase
MEAYARALELKPDHHNGLGLCCETQGHYQQAVELFDRAVGIHEEFAQAHHNRSRMLTLLGRAEEAVEAALRCSAIESQEANVAIARS